MKTLFFAFLFVSTQAHAALPPSLAKLVGSYESRGQRIDVIQAGNTLAIRTHADLSGDPACGTRVSPALGQYVANSAAEVHFQLSKGSCPNMDGALTLHYNRALTGVDVFLIDVVIHRNSMPSNVHNITNGRSIRWSLTKLN
jgi:hypothetical protein